MRLDCFSVVQAESRHWFPVMIGHLIVYGEMWSIKHTDWTCLEYSMYVGLLCWVVAFSIALLVTSSEDQWQNGMPLALKHCICWWCPMHESLATLGEVVQVQSSEHLHMKCCWHINLCCFTTLFTSLFLFEFRPDTRPSPGRSTLVDPGRPWKLCMVTSTDCFLSHSQWKLCSPGH